MSSVKKVVIVDALNPIKDKTSLNKKWDGYDLKHKPVKGHVTIKQYDRDGNLIRMSDKDNLVVIVGRSWLMQKAFNTDLDPSNPVRHLALYWFSVGSGGASPANPFTPIAPNDSDTDLFNKEQFGTDPALYADSGYKKNFTSLEYPDDTSAKLTLTVDYSEIADGTLINEIGLYASNSSDPSTANEFVLFSHATFASYYKDSSTKLVIEWNFLF